MKKRLILIVVILFAACSKKNETTGHVQFTNDSRFVYEAYIDNKPQSIIEPFSTQTFNTAVGYHTITVKQTPGYLVIEVDTTIAAGQTFQLLFPF